MPGGYRAWWGALTVMIITAALVVLDVGDGAVHRYWSRHSFTSSVLSGLLVLLLTVLVVDRVTRIRHLKGQSRAIAAQAAVIIAQATRAVDAVVQASPKSEDNDAAAEELRTYTQMLLTSAPVLIDADVSRAFLESAQRLAAQLYRTLRDGRDESAEHRRTRLDKSVKQLRDAAAPLLTPLTRDQQAAVSSTDDEPSASPA